MTGACGSSSESRSSFTPEGGLDAVACRLTNGVEGVGLVDADE